MDMLNIIHRCFILRRYGGASEVVKDGQNSLYERYYDLIKQGYQVKVCG